MVTSGKWTRGGRADPLASLTPTSPGVEGHVEGPLAPVAFACQKLPSFSLELEPQKADEPGLESVLPFLRCRVCVCDAIDAFRLDPSLHLRILSAFASPEYEPSFAALLRHVEALFWRKDVESRGSESVVPGLPLTFPTKQSCKAESDALDETAVSRLDDSILKWLTCYQLGNEARTRCKMPSPVSPHCLNSNR